MGVSINNKSVDFDKLGNEFRRRGMTFGNASAQLGRSSSYFSGMRPKGYLPESTLIMLDAMWNIKYGDIAPAVVEEPKSVEESEPTESESLNITKEELRYLITEAIKDAFVWYANM